jgi:LmbE family N-acetylglucosaminyl deacetylase
MNPLRRRVPDATCGVNDDGMSGEMERTDEALWRVLQPLRSGACWLMTGAHPDDEWNGFLAWLALGRGVHTIYACSTRGEGGQNALGPERGAALGALRTREMECAAEEIGLGVRWLGRGAINGWDDPIYDFGFSKSGEDTLARWGKERLIARLVRLIRTERPDAISPTFLDVPGQHGHHRAMTRCTREAAALAGDAGFRLPETDPGAWRVGKIYLPAFGGGGGSYDDEEPPPPETIRVDLGARCEALAASWAQLGERSRCYHRSQGMGRAVADGPRPFPLYLVAGVADVAAPMDGIAHRLRELAGLLPTGSGARAMRAADAAIDDAVSAFPDRAAVATALRRAQASLAEVVLAEGAEDIGRRVELKRRQIARALGTEDSVAARATALVVPAGQRLRQNTYPHTGTISWLEPAEAPVLRAEIAIDPGARVGVVAGEADETLNGLRLMNIAAEPVSDAMLDGDDLGRFTTLVIGIFAFGQRPALLRNRDRLMAWVEAGGSLVTLYHRPGDGWQDGRTPPLRIVIGNPSIRWRVTVPTAPVTVLQPRHAVLRYPNAIGAADWEGWVRERGLYFARDWDDAYVPLLAMADPGEAPLRGGLLAAPVGRGRHVHVALALHHQLSALVPGAFRLLANLVAGPPPHLPEGGKC